MPEKSGVGAALRVPLLSGAGACPKAGVVAAAAVANVPNKRKFRRCAFMPSPVPGSPVQPRECWHRRYQRFPDCNRAG
jgi:hypothetical protein